MKPSEEPDASFRPIELMLCHDFQSRFPDAIGRMPPELAYARQSIVQLNLAVGDERSAKASLNCPLAVSDSKPQAADRVLLFQPPNDLQLTAMFFEYI